MNVLLSDNKQKPYFTVRLLKSLNKPHKLAEEERSRFAKSSEDIRQEMWFL